MMKNFEADQKRLRAIMLNFDEKKQDMQDQEKKERQELILMIKDSFNLFKLAFNDQTVKAERGAGVYINDSLTDSTILDVSNATGKAKPPKSPNISSRNNHQKESSQDQLVYKQNETQNALLEESVAAQMSNRIGGRKMGDFGMEFDNLVIKIVRSTITRTNNHHVAKEAGRSREEVGLGRV